MQDLKKRPAVLKSSAVPFVGGEPSLTRLWETVAVQSVEQKGLAAGTSTCSFGRGAGLTHLDHDASSSVHVQVVMCRHVEAYGSVDIRCVRNSTRCAGSRAIKGLLVTRFTQPASSLRLDKRRTILCLEYCLLGFASVQGE
jgi:hypothetical protein